MPIDVLAKTGEAAKSGPIGLAIILILCIVCYFLFKSMSKHLKRVREEFPAAPRVTERPAATEQGDPQHATPDGRAATTADEHTKAD